MSGKFKVGDRVRLAMHRPLVAVAVGEVGVVTKCASFDTCALVRFYDAIEPTNGFEDGWWVATHALELVPAPAPTPQPKFAIPENRVAFSVGDKVRVVRNVSYSHAARNGAEGVVASFVADDPKSLMVRLTKTGNGNDTHLGDTYFYDASVLDLIVEPASKPARVWETRSKYLFHITDERIEEWADEAEAEYRRQLAEGSDEPAYAVESGDALLVIWGDSLRVYRIEKSVRIDA